MVLNGINNSVKVVGTPNIKQATIASDKIAKLQYILTKGLYLDAVSATINEISANAIDSMLSSGKDIIKNPVIVKLGKDTNGYYFSVEDKGIGIDSYQFENVLMNYLSSTKEDDNEAIGHFGIGSKSFLSLNRPATFTIRKEGREWQYLAYEGSEFCEYTLLYEKETTEDNGLRFQISIKDYSEYCEFIGKAKKKLAFYDTVVLDIDGRIEDNTIYRNELFQFSGMWNNSMMCMSLKDVQYDINWESLGIPRINIPICIRLQLTDGVTPTPSRENLIMNDFTKKLIKDKINQIADWFMTKWNEQVPEEFERIKDVFPYLSNTSKDVEIAGKSFCFDQLLPYTNIKPKPYKVKDVKSDRLYWFMNHQEQMLNRDIKPYGFLYNRALTEKAKRWHSMFSGSQIKSGTKILTDKITTRIKAYLESKNKKGFSGFVYKYEPKAYTIPEYLHLLGSSPNKKEWKAKIKEFQNVRKQLIEDYFANEIGVENTQEYKDWEIGYLASLKQIRASNPGNYKRIDKQAGQVTISYLKPREIGKGYKLEKKAFNVQDLSKLPFISVYTTDVEKAKGFGKYFSLKNVQFCHIGVGEIKKLPKLKSFITMDGLQKTKPYVRCVSAILAERVVDTFKTVYRNNNEIVQKCLQNHYKDYEILKQYVQKNYIQMQDSKLEESMLAVAEENNLYDLEVLSLVNRIKADLVKFDFLSCLTVPSQWNEDAVKRYNRTINSMLLMKTAKYKDYLENYQLVKNDSLCLEGVNSEEDVEITSSLELEYV